MQRLTRMLAVVDLREVSSRLGATDELLAAPLRLRWSATSLARRVLICPSSACSSGVRFSVSMSSSCTQQTQSSLHIEGSAPIALPLLAGGAWGWARGERRGRHVLMLHIVAEGGSHCRCPGQVEHPQQEQTHDLTQGMLGCSARASDRQCTSCSM